jgi:hypothetical protein
MARGTSACCLKAQLKNEGTKLAKMKMVSKNLLSSAVSRTVDFAIRVKNELARSVLYRSDISGRWDQRARNERTD